MVRSWLILVAFALIGAAPPDQEHVFRSAAESAVRARLIDPDSAQFEWPYGFIYGYWKPFLQKRIDGYVTCGRVNARNRFGGYTGSSAFAVVLSEDGEVRYLEVGTAGQFDLTEAACEKTAKSLPAAAPEPVEQAQAATPTSVADELAKLAALRDRGIITQAEFDAQKAKLLGERP